MSDGTRCIVRDLGLVKGGKGLKHHETLLVLSLKGLTIDLSKRIAAVFNESERSYLPALGAARWFAVLRRGRTMEAAE